MTAQGSCSSFPACSTFALYMHKPHNSSLQTSLAWQHQLWCWLKAACVPAAFRLGVLIEVNCETDFVARGAKFKELVQDMAMQAAASPSAIVVSTQEVPEAEMEKERSIEMGKEDIQNKPEAIRFDWSPGPFYTCTLCSYNLQSSIGHTLSCMHRPANDYYNIIVDQRDLQLARFVSVPVCSEA